MFEMETHISCLFPEILAIIFSYLEVKDKGRVAQVCAAWRDASYHKSVWRGVEAKAASPQGQPVPVPQPPDPGHQEGPEQAPSAKPQLLRGYLGRGHDPSLQHDHLCSLNLRSCDNISDTGVMHLAMGSLKLSGLDVSFCDKIGDQSLAYIAQGLYQLKSLSLCSCHISDDGINRMVRQMHELRTLNIGQCVRITDKGLELIADHLTQLTGIDLYGCTKITKRGLERITQLPCLKVLNLGLWQMTE
ncbi:hypothetical protein CRUP_031138 [Coryphaenoides rupestris]|nr:hypothetical protein CRUP_031138 [Coryphaenoides rupestris]